MAFMLRQAQHEGLTLSLSKGEARVSSSARWYETDAALQARAWRRVRWVRSLG